MQTTRTLAHFEAEQRANHRLFEALQPATQRTGIFSARHQISQGKYPPQPSSWLMAFVLYPCQSKKTLFGTGQVKPKVVSAFRRVAWQEKRCSLVLKALYRVSVAPPV